ncbi:MAG: ABC transporter permease [Lewinellaceae bacterium]|nr:ABC transporter permease [Lewinellaceae bacterium]
MRIISLAWRNIITKPLNLFLTVTLFSLCIGLMTFMLLFNTQLKEKFDKNLANIDVVVGAKGSPLQMILCSMFHIDNPTGNITIKEATPLLRKGHPLIEWAVPLSLGDSYKSYRIVGTNSSFLDVYDAELIDGHLWENDFETTIGYGVAQDLGLHIGDTFVSSHGFVDDEDLAHDHAPFKIVGILKPTGSVIDQLILTTSATIWHVHEHEGDENESTHADTTEVSTHQTDAHHEEMHGHSQDENSPTTLSAGTINQNNNEGLLLHPDEDITSILIKYKNKTSFQSLNFARNINENTSMQAASPAIEMNRLYSMIGVGADALKALAILIGLVSALSIFVTLLRSMKERKYELSILRVLGGSRLRIFSLIMYEGIIIAVIGFIVGTVIAHLGMEVMAHYLKQDFRYSFTGWRWLTEEWMILLISIEIGLISAFIPALQAAKTDINKTLSEKN